MSVCESIVSVVLDQLKHQTNRIVVAVSGPQGSGKTTVTKEAVRVLAEKHRISAIGISLDDFYKPHTDLEALAKRGNPLLQKRGLPGTHDTQLMLDFLREFKAGKTGLRVPNYDKSLFNGAGDRSSNSTQVPSDTVAVLLEGWMVGFKPIGIEKLKLKLSELQTYSVAPTLADLQEIETSLADYQPVWDQFDAFVRLIPEKLDYIRQWRLQQEHDLWASKGSGMTDDEVQRFVDQYMPCYFLYNETLPTDNAVCFRLDAQHNATRQ